MSKRHILEDSDSDDDGVPPALNSFLTPEEEHAIDRCNIKMNKNQGKYSEEEMFQAIAMLGEPPLEKAETAGDARHFYQKYRVKKGTEKSFFDRDMYRVHGAGGEEFESSISEETVLLDTEAIQRSEKAVFNRMFKNKEMGGMVIFGPWWNYALQRILQLSSEGLKDESLENYTAVKIIKSLFTFIKGSGQLIKNGKALQRLNTDFGIDWVENVKAARKVINQCGPSHYLDKELKEVETHLEGLKSTAKPKPAAATDIKPATNVAAGTSTKKSRISEEEIKKKNDEARKKRMQGMRAAMRKVPSTFQSGANGAAATSPQEAVTPAPVRESFARGREAPRSADSRSRFDAPKSQGHNPATAGDDHSRNRSPGQHATSNDTYERKSPVRSTSGDGQSNTRIPSPAARRNTSIAAPGDGWGRKRGEDSSAKVFKTKGSYTHRRGTNSFDIKVESVQLEPLPIADRNERSAPREENYKAGMDALNDLRSRDSSGRGRDDHSRDQSRGREYESRDRYDSSRSDKYSSRRSDSRFDSRSSDRGRDGGRSYDREDYSRGSSRSGDYSRDKYGGDEPRRSRGSQDGSSRDHGGSGYGQESRSRSQDSDGEVRPQKRYRASEETATAPAAPTGAAGRGRGAHVNKPAWMTQPGQSSTSSGPTGGMSGNGVASATNPGTDVAGMNANYPTSASSNASAAAPAGGAGRGRGAHVNKPAWMTRQGSASSNGPTGMGHQAPAPIENLNQHAHGTNPSVPSVSSSNRFSANPSVAVPPGGAGRGRGAHVNMPAWMTRQESAPSNGAPSMGQQAPVPSVNQPATAITQMNALNAIGPSGGVTANGQGRGRGRGRGRGAHVNKPAWMTNPANTNP